MNETTLALCKKPVIGLVMWLSSLCATNQALKDTFIDLTKEGVLVDQRIDVPMDEGYSAMLLFTSSEKYDPANPRRFFFSHFCAYSREQREAWKKPSQSLALNFEIKTPNGQPVTHGTFKPMCDQEPGNPRDLYLGNVDLKRGTYTLLITNQHSVVLESDGKIEIILKGVGAGYP
jgi:hypothetical protein